MGFVFVLLSLAVFLIIGLMMDMFLDMFIPRKPLLYLRLFNFLSKRKKFKIRKKSNYQWEASFLKRIKLEVNEFSSYTQFILRYSYSTVFSYKYEKSANRITSFECDEKMNVIGKESYLLETIQNMIHHFYTNMKATQKNEEVLFDFLNKATLSQKKSDTKNSVNIPESLQFAIHKIESISAFLIGHEKELDVEKKHYLSSIMDERIPNIFKEYEILSPQTKIQYEKEILHTLDSIQETFSNWKNELEHQSSQNLKKQLETLKQVINV